MLRVIALLQSCQDSAYASFGFFFQSSCKAVSSPSQARVKPKLSPSIRGVSSGSLAGWVILVLGDFSQPESLDLQGALVKIAFDAAASHHYFTTDCYSCSNGLVLSGG